jgi:hypothetical protein
MKRFLLMIAAGIMGLAGGVGRADDPPPDFGGDFDPLADVAG